MTTRLPGTLSKRIEKRTNKIHYSTTLILVIPASQRAHVVLIVPSQEWHNKREKQQGSPETYKGFNTRTVQIESDSSADENCQVKKDEWE